MKQNETKTDENGTKKDEYFECKCCDYNTCHFGHWKRHLETKKHKKLEMKQNETSETKKDKIVTKGTKKNKLNKYHCENCGEIFGSRTTLWRHKKKCDMLSSKVDVITTETSTLALNTVLQENAALREQLKEQNDRMYEIARASTSALANQTAAMNNCNVTNNQTNNNFNINLFLNEKCSDALTIQDFAKKLQLTMSDLMTAKENKVLGLANIVVKNLEPLALTERPLHCTENEEWFVKDESSGWEKDSGKAAQITEHSIRTKWPEVFQTEHPDWKDNEQLSSDYVQLAGMAASKMDDKQRKKLAKHMKSKCSLNKKDTET